jgi:mannosyltransferase OCH1-like enzyme
METLDFEEMDRYLLAQNDRIIHQVWFGTIPNKKQAKKTYEKLKTYRDSWKIKNPTWCHTEWTKNMCSVLVKTHFPEHLDMYNAYKWEIQRCDAVRTFILYRYGGLYADMDYYCNRPFDEALKKYTGKIYIVQTPNHTNHGSNSLMYSKKNNIFWKKVFMEMEIVKDNYDKYVNKHYIVVATTGPTMLNRVFHRYKFRYGVSLLPHETFHPYSIQSDIRTFTTDNPDVFAIHFGQMSWGNNGSHVLIMLARIWPLMVFIVLALTMPLVIQWLSIRKWKRR